MLKNIFKKIYKKLSCQSGEFLTVLAITGIISLAVGLYTYGEVSQQALKNKVDVTKYDDIKASGDPGKDQEKNSNGFVKIAVEGGKTVVGIYDDTGLLTIADKANVFTGKVINKKTDNTEDNAEIKTKLTSSGLTGDKLMIDTAKVIKKQIIKNATGDISSAEIDGMLYDILTQSQEEADEILKLADIREELADIDDMAVIDSMGQLLKDKGKLEHTGIVKLKTQLGRYELDKNFIEEKLASYKYYEDKGYTIKDTSDFEGLKDRLDEVKKKITETAGQIEKIQAENEKTKIAEETPETTAETSTESTTAQEIAETVIYMSGQGKLTGFTESNIELVIDLETGTVTGNIKCKGSQPYYGENGEDSGIRCVYVFNSPLTGSIDLATYKLSVYAEGYVTGISGGVCSSIKSTHYKTTLKGILNEAATYVNGTSTMGGTWSASK